MPLPETLQTIPEEDEDVGEVEENEQVIETQGSRPTQLNSSGKHAVATVFKRPLSSPSTIVENDEQPSCSRTMCAKPLAHGLDPSLCLKKKISSQSNDQGYESQQSFACYELSTKFMGPTDPSKPSGGTYTGRFEKQSHSRSASVNWALYDSITRSFPLDRDNASSSLDTTEQHRRYILTLIDELAESRNEAIRLSKIVANADMKYASVIDNLKDMNQKLKVVEKDLTDSYIVVREIHRATQRYMNGTANARLETVQEEDLPAARPNLPPTSARGLALGREIEHHVRLKIEKERLKQKIRDIFDQLLDDTVDETNA